MPHRRTWTFQSHSPGGDNVLPNLIHASSGPNRVNNLHGTSTGSAVFTRLMAESLYFTIDRSFTLAHGGSGPHLIHDSLSPPEWTTQTASWSVQPFLQGSWSWPTRRPTYRPRRSVCNNRPHLRSTVMRPETWWNWQLTGWPLFFNNDFPWLFHDQTNEFPWPIGTAYFFQINHTRFVNAYQNKNIFPAARQSVSK